MHILGIETSCDETSAAIVVDGRTVLSNIIASSVQDFLLTGGVIPEIAARRQMEFMLPVINRALEEASISYKKIDAIAVTKGPGLLTSLIVGIATARSLATAWHKPLIGVHHMLGHRSSTWLGHGEEILFPVLTLSVSGGHTELMLRRNHTDCEILAATRDDAAGEAFDKGARLLGLPYPGGPALAKLASNGDATLHRFPRPLAGKEAMDFSFSGLKTSLKYLLRDRGGLEKLSPREQADIAASYQEAIIDHLYTRLQRALKQQPDIREVHIVGGVAANRHLREVLASLSCTVRYPLTIPYCTDNAAMIAAAGYFLTQETGEQAYAEFTTTTS